MLKLKLQAPKESLMAYISITHAPDQVFYGGNQQWWGTGTVGEHYGCGVIAATNYILYLAKHKYIRINNEAPNLETLTIKKYIKLANILWTYIRPSTGIIKKDTKPNKFLKNKKGHGVTVNILIKGMKKYMKAQGFYCNFSVMKSRKVPDLDKAFTFIEESLLRGLPVMALSVKNKGKVYEWHWVTITGFKKEGAVFISTWGSKEVIKDLTNYWGGKSLLDRQYLVSMRTLDAINLSKDRR